MAVEKFVVAGIVSVSSVAFVAGPVVGQAGLFAFVAIAADFAVAVAIAADFAVAVAVAITVAVEFVVVVDIVAFAAADFAVAVAVATTAAEKFAVVVELAAFVVVGIVAITAAVVGLIVDLTAAVVADSVAVASSAAFAVASEAAAADSARKQTYSEIPSSADIVAPPIERSFEPRAASAGEAADAEEAVAVAGSKKPTGSWSTADSAAERVEFGFRNPGAEDHSLAAFWFWP